MSKLNLKKSKPVSGLIAVICIILALVYGWILYDMISLKLNEKKTVGLITYPGHGYKSKLIYEFCVDGQVYYGTKRMGDYSDLMPGDSLLIRYDSTRPSNNEAIIYFRQELVKDSLPDTVYCRQYCTAYGKKIGRKKAVDETERKQ